MVTAHPDDVDFGAAGPSPLDGGRGRGRLLHLHRRGRGRLRPGGDRAEIPGIRRAEQRAAAKGSASADVRFLGYRDGAPGADIELRGTSAG